MRFLPASWPVMQWVKKRLFFTLCVIVLFVFVLNIWAHQQTIRWMKNQIYVFQQTCQINNITLSTPIITSQNWLWGASLALSNVQFRTRYNGLIIGASAPSIRIGGTWNVWLWSAIHGKNPPVRFEGISVIKVLDENTTNMTLHLQNARLFLSSINENNSHFFDLMSDGAILASEHTTAKIKLSSLMAHIYWNPSAPSEGSHFAINMNAEHAQITHTPIISDHTLSHLHLTAALPKCSNSIRDSLSQGCTLRLHDLSTDIALFPETHKQLSSPTLPVHLSLGGQIHMPDKNGVLTLQITHWRDTLTQLLDNQSVHPISSYLVQAFQHNKIPQDISPHVPKDHPLSISLSLSHGVPTGLTTEKINIIRQFFVTESTKP